MHESPSENSQILQTSLVFRYDEHGQRIVVMVKDRSGGHFLIKVRFVKVA